MSLCPLLQVSLLLQITHSWSWQWCTMLVFASLLSLSSQKLSCSSNNPQREVGSTVNWQNETWRRNWNSCHTQGPFSCIIVLKNSSALTFNSLLLFFAVLQVHSSSTEDDPAASDPHLFWRTVLKSVGNTALAPCVLHLLCLQWAIWLSTCQLKTIQEFQVRSCS